MYHLTSGFSTNFMPLRICQKEYCASSVWTEEDSVTEGSVMVMEDRKAKS
jgi:hypothetical protein